MVAFRDHTPVCSTCTAVTATSLEYGIIEEHGLRCCYHGRLFDVDGTVLEMPGEPAFERMRDTVSQGAYPTHEFAGILFVYMGPPVRIPVFPVFDRLTIPGITRVPSIRWPVDCNYVQVVENALDPQHTAVLHVIPQLRGMDHFGDTFGNHPYLMWADSSAGADLPRCASVDDNVWVRSAEVVARTPASSTRCSRRARRKYASDPFMSFWFLPVDDSTRCALGQPRHRPRDHAVGEAARARNFGQLPGRPYREAQWIPGDYEVQVSQGAVNVHALEHLGTIDQGVVKFRRYLRENMARVARGEDPHGVYYSQADVPSTSCNDHVVDVAEIGGDPEDGAALLRFAATLPERYRQKPPMAELARQAGGR